MSEHVRMLTEEDVIAIHAASLARFGGPPGMLDEGLPEPAAAQPSSAVVLLW